MDETQAAQEMLRQKRLAMGLDENGVTPGVKPLGAVLKKALSGNQVDPETKKPLLGLSVFLSKEQATRTCPHCKRTIEPAPWNLLGQQAWGPLRCDCEAAELERIEEENRQTKQEQECRTYRFAFPTEDMGELNGISLRRFVPRPGTEMAYKMTAHYIKTMPNPDPPGLLLWGGQGNGKSHLAGAIVTHAHSLNMTVAWVHTATWLRYLGSLNDNPGKRESQISLASDANLLVLDDLGGENLTTARAEYLLSILDTRYRKRKPLVVTTNRSLSELPTALTPKDEQESGMKVKGGARIVDRLLEMSVVVENKAASYRVEMAERRLEALAKEVGSGG